MRALAVFISFIPTCFSLNILLFLIGTNQFERNTFEFLAQQLALRHHNVITVKPILIPEEPRLVKPKLHLVKEKTMKNMVTRSIYDPLEAVGNTIPWQQNYEEEAYQRVYWQAHNASCYKMINSNLMDSLKKETLDVAIVYAGNPCQLAITHVLGVPTIYYDVDGLSDETLSAAGVPLNLDVPSTNCAIPEATGIFNRLRNGFCLLKEQIIQSGLPLIPSLLSERFRNLDGPITKMFAEDYAIKKRFPNFPDVNQLKQDAALFFVNTDPLLEYNRALPPNVIPIGGLQLDYPKPLFAPWNASIASAEEGLIIVSLGTQANSSAMSPSQAKAILGALSQLTKYRIYWRIGPKVQLAGIKEEDVPSHINLTAFIPQNDLLAHKSCRLLVTNGGMASVMEAVAHGVPVVGIPLYGINRHNLGKVVNKGLGLVVKKSALTETNLLKTIRTVLDSAKYKTVAKDMSKEFKSRGSTPFNLALHYIEHVGKHHKAAFFERPPRNFFHQVNFDLLTVLFLLLVSPIYLLCGLFGFCCRKSDNTTKKDKSPPKKETKKDK